MHKHPSFEPFVIRISKISVNTKSLRDGQDGTLDTRLSVKENFPQRDSGTQGSLLVLRKEIVSLDDF